MAKKPKDEEIIEADFDELSVDDIPGATIPDEFTVDDDDLIGEPGAPALKKVGGLRRKKKKKVGARAGGGGGPGGIMRKKKGLGARRGAMAAPGGGTGGAGPAGRSEGFEESVSSGREILKQMIQRLTPEEGEGEGKRKGMAQALRRVARGYRELEQEVARLEGELGRKS